MILFLLFQRRVSGMVGLLAVEPWFANIPFETCGDISILAVQDARFHGFPRLSKSAP